MTNNLEYLKHNGGYDSVLDEFEYQRALLNECSTNEANECALVALAFTSTDEEECAEMAALRSSKWWCEAALAERHPTLEEGDERAELAALSQEEASTDERADMAALSEETQWMERAESAALSDSNMYEMHDDTAESDVRAFAVAHQTLEDFESTLVGDVVDISEKIDAKAQEEVPTRATSSVERASTAAHQDQEELSHDMPTDRLRSWVFCTGWSMY